MWVSYSTKGGTAMFPNNFSSHKKATQSPDQNLPPPSTKETIAPESEQRLIEPVVFDKSPLLSENKGIQDEANLIEPVVFDNEPQSEETQVDLASSYNTALSENLEPHTELQPLPLCETETNHYQLMPKPQVESVSAELYQPPRQTPQVGLTMPGANVLVNPVIHQGPPILMSTPAKAETDTSLQESGNKPTAYQLAHELIKANNIKVEGDNMYYYNGMYYERLSDRALKRQITGRFRSVMEAGGSSQFRREIRESILDEPALADKAIKQDPNVVSCLNGVVSLVTGKLMPHDPKWLTTYCLQFNYLLGIPEPPYFLQFLEDITGGDNVLKERILQSLGYILSPDTSGKVFFLLQGVPDSGKSVFSLLMRLLFNENAVISLEVHDLSDRFAVSELFGKALCISADLPSAVLDSRAVSKIKQFTGGDSVTADQKFKERISFTCTSKFVLATNHPLIIKGDDQAFTNRAVVIPFKFAAPKERQDRTLLDKLISERDAIGTYALCAYSRLRNSNYIFAGNYRINEVVSEMTLGDDLATQICCFTMANFERCEDSLVLVSDARKRFEEQYIPTSSQQFTPIFERAVFEFFGGNPCQAYNGNRNHRKHIRGIKWKDSAAR